MKSLKKIGIAAVILTATILSSCGKYEDGPKVSLLSKKSRIVNSWKLAKYMYNGMDVPLSGFIITYDIKKDDTYSTSFGGGAAETGTWAFSSDKEKVVFTPNATSDAQEFTITRLKAKELWLKLTDGTDIEEYHFEAN